MLGKTLKIEDLITDSLSGGQIEIIDLIVKINEIRPKTSKQAVYKALRVLKKNEIIVQAHGEVALSSIWLKKLHDFTEKTELHYKINDQPSLDFLKLKEGEKIVYSFKTFEATDLFWGHAFIVLFNSMPQASPVFIFSPHEWFLLARPESEIFLLNRFKETGKKLFFLCDNRNPLDLEVAKYFDNETTNYYASPDKYFDKPNYYVNILNNFLIEVLLDPKISGLIDEFYKKTTSLDDAAKNRLLEIIKTKGKNKLVIYRNERKARKIKNIFKKVFIY